MTRSLSEQLRLFINASDMSPYEIAREAKIDRSIISKFLNGRSRPRMETIEKLVATLELELTPKRRRKGR